MSRGLTFWNDATIALIKNHFVAAAVPTWLARAKSPEGEFLRSAGVDKQWVTSSGYMTCLSASGQMLGRAPTPAVLEAFKKLPESERRPGAIAVPPLAEGERVIATPPAGGLVLKVHARFLAKEGDGYRPAQPTDFPLMREKPDTMRSWQLFLQPNTEYLWLTGAEWRGLIPDHPASGQKLEVASALAERLARFHLTPQRATTSEGGVVSKKAVKAARLTLQVDEVSPARLRMSLSGFIHWGSDYDEAKATTPNGPLPQGFATPLYGRLEYDRSQEVVTRFDLVAPGEIWGRWGDANGKSMVVERPGRNPFGFALELAKGDTPTNRIPPGGNGTFVLERGYFAAAR